MNARRKTVHKIYLCGGDFRAGPRDECPNALHDWPLPTGYVDAADVAQSRLARGWSNQKCPQCGLYGWAPSSRIKPEMDHKVPMTSARLRKVRGKGAESNV